MNQSGDEPAECPLCMEPFEVDDLNFFPCTCGYQICRFCWHRIRTDENGLCPACRKAYPENPADFKPLSQEQVAKLKAEKRQKEQQRKQKATESRKHLADVRVVQKNLVFVVGLPIRLADPNVLKKHEYFGKFGKIQKVVINQSNTYAGALGPSASAYVTYNRYEDALRAIQAINNIWVDNRQIKTSLGTTKYCSHFIKAQTCPKSDCMYLHDLGDPEASFTKEEMHRGKHQEYERNLFEQFNNSISQERKTTPSPPALGNSLPSTEPASSTFPSATKEAWLSVQNGGTTTTTTTTTVAATAATTQNNSGGGTVSESATTGSEAVSNVSTSTSNPSTTTNNSQSVSGSSTKQQQLSSKTKQVKEKNSSSSNEKSANSSKKKGKEKSSNGTSNSNSISNNNNNNNNNHTTANNNISNSNQNGSSNSNVSIIDATSNSNNNNSNRHSNNNVNVADKNSESVGKDKNKEKDKKVNGDKSQVDNNSANNAKVLLSNNRSLYGKSNSIFSSNNLGKKSPTGSKDSLPNGFIKLPENVSLDYESGFGDANSLSDKESTEGVDSKLLGNSETERLGSAETDGDKCLVNGFQTENGPFDKAGYNQRHGGYGYQNGGLNFSNNICQQNLFNNYMSLNKFGGQIKNDNLLMENNDVYLNQTNNHLLGQQNFLLKHQLSQQQQQQQQQQRNQPNLQQIIIQQQNMYQQPQNQFSQDYRLVQQQAQQPQQQTLNGLHSQHFNYMQQSNLRDQLLLQQQQQQQQQQKQIILNNYPPTGNSFIHLPNSENMVVMDGVIPQHKFSENGLGHGNLYSSEYKVKDNRKGDEAGNEKGGTVDGLGDDELGFDPFHETQKALADLMEKELLIQQNKKALQHKNDQYYQSAQCYQNQHGFDGCQRGFNQLQVSMLNQQNNMLGGKVKFSLLSQLHSQQIINSAKQKSSGSNRLDGVRCTLPPPGFASPSQNGPPGTHLNSFGQGMSRSSNSSRKIPPFMGISNNESFHPHYVPNGVTKSEDWPESLRSLVQEGRTSSPSSASASYSSSSKGWSNLGNCPDWTALDPAIVSSSRSPHLSIHNQSLLNNQGLSHLHANHIQNQMRQLNLGSVLDHNNWSSTHRQNEDNWSTHIQTSVPPPGFSLPHAGGELKKPVISGIEGLE